MYSVYSLHVLVIISFCMQRNFNVQRSTKLIGSDDVCWFFFDLAEAIWLFLHFARFTLLLRWKLISIISLQIYVPTLYNQIKSRYIDYCLYIIIICDAYIAIWARVLVLFQHICLKFRRNPNFSDPIRNPTIFFSFFFQKKSIKIYYFLEKICTIFSPFLFWVFIGVVFSFGSDRIGFLYLWPRAQHFQYFFFIVPKIVKCSLTIFAVINLFIQYERTALESVLVYRRW